MHISSPFVVVSLILAVFVVSILFSTSSKEDKPSAH
jgi:regulatory protein YycI of two-component signal transduction system YycFG